MAKKLVIAIVTICLCSTDADAARRGGLRSRWSARRTARAYSTEKSYSTPQAAWNAYYRAAIRHDWDTAFRCLDSESREVAVANAVVALLCFSSDDGSGGAIARLSRRHRLDLTAMGRELNEVYESRMGVKNGIIYNTFNEAEHNRAFADTKASLVRRIRDHAAFYRDAMEVIANTWIDDEAQEPDTRKPTSDEAPQFTEVRIKGSLANASYPTGNVKVEGTEFPLAQTVEFTFEDGGWRIRELD